MFGILNFWSLSFKCFWTTDFLSSWYSQRERGKEIGYEGPKIFGLNKKGPNVKGPKIKGTESKKWPKIKKRSKIKKKWNKIKKGRKWPVDLRSPSLRSSEHFWLFFLFLFSLLLYGAFKNYNISCWTNFWLPFLDKGKGVIFLHRLSVFFVLWEKLWAVNSYEERSL